MKTWSKPTSEQVDHAVSKLGRPGAYRYFFLRLQNPEWVQPLRTRGYFTDPPNIRRDEVRGTITIPDWPALDYLARIAPEAPGVVADIALKLPETDNQRVRQSVVGIALRLPPAISAKLL